MTQQEDSEMKAPAAPNLVAPREEAIVDGTAVTFEWEPVEAATEYFLEVASDTTFETLVFAENVGDTTSITVADVFPTDEGTYYWRVFSRNAAGESHGDVVESFISGTPDDAAASLVSPDQAEGFGPLAAVANPSKTEKPVNPDQEEEIGPLPGLLKANVAEVAAEVTGAEEAYQAEAELGVQHEGVGAASILGFIFATITAIAMAVVFVFFYSGFVAEETARKAAAGVDYPELRQVEATADEQLEQYKILNDAEGVYRIPIDRAMELMVNETYREPGTYSPELQLLPE
ncbi:MAG TPA: hypothetical protein VKP65_24365 [Rhodothermales bacterium]|nr:hypothetical protein [Rhodothermales bacterium]